MAVTCGYICPQCEGSGFLKDTLEDCPWCRGNKTQIKTEEKPKEISEEDWMKNVHEGNCCTDDPNTN